MKNAQAKIPDIHNTKYLENGTIRIKLQYLFCRYLLIAMFASCSIRANVSEVWSSNEKLCYKWKKCISLDKVYGKHSTTTAARVQVKSNVPHMIECTLWFHQEEEQCWFFQASEMLKKDLSVLYDDIIFIWQSELLR